MNKLFVYIHDSYSGQIDTSEVSWPAAYRQNMEWSFLEEVSPRKAEIVLVNHWWSHVFAADANWLSLPKKECIEKIENFRELVEVCC